MLDSVLAREIRQFLGSPTDKEERYMVLQQLGKTATDMEQIDRYNHKEVFQDCLRKHGRAAVAVCIASTLWERKDRLGKWNLPWAIDVMDLWKWRVRDQHTRACVYGYSHPTTICDYAEEFIKLNSV